MISVPHINGTPNLHAINIIKITTTKFHLFSVFAYRSERVQLYAGYIMCPLSKFDNIVEIEIISNKIFFLLLKIQFKNEKKKIKTKFFFLDAWCKWCLFKITFCSFRLVKTFKKCFQAIGHSPLGFVLVCDLILYTIVYCTITIV